MADIIERLAGAAGAYDSYSSVTKQPAKYALVYVHTFNFVQVHLQGPPRYKPYFADNPLIGYHKFIGPTLYSRCNKQGTKAYQREEYLPMVGGFVYHLLIFYQVIVHVIPHRKAFISRR